MMTSMGQMQGVGANMGSPITPQSVVRQDFGGQQISHNAGTADNAVAAQVQAQVQARYIMAMRMPRDWATVRQALINDCSRVGFASAARYSKPVAGGKVEGFSIRFAEAALRCMRNVMPEVMTVYDDPQKRIIRVQLTDLESNLTYSQDIVIEKLVERSNIKPNQQVVNQRQNSKGNVVYVVVANEGELENKQAALISKAMRNQCLRMLPADIADDCLDVIDKVIRKEIKSSPAEHRKKICDAFVSIDVQPKQLAEYLGISKVDEMGADDIVDLRKIYTSIKSGEARWRDVYNERMGADSEAIQAVAAGKGGGLKGKIAAKTKKTEVVAEPAAAKPSEDEVAAAFKKAGERTSNEEEAAGEEEAPWDKYNATTGEVSSDGGG